MTLSQTEIQELASQISFPCISLYLPTEKAGAETRKNPIRFKNLLSEAETKLRNLEDTDDLTSQLDTAKSYIENYDFWQHQESGLAFFISQAGIKYYTLGSDFTESVTVSDRFYLQPLLPIVNQNTKFYLLTLAQNEVQLFIGNRDGIKQIALPDSVPSSLAEALKYDDPEKQTQYHSGDSGKSPIYHGQGVGTTDNKDEIRRFLQQIDSGIQSAFAQEKAPLILAGVEYLLPMYHEANSYNNLVEKGITGNPENVSHHDLHQQAWSIIQEQLNAERQKAIDRYQQLSTSNEASSNLEQIVAAAAKGQIDTLFFLANTQQWGRFNLQENRVELHQEQTINSVDLIDFAVVNTYLQGGKVYLLESEQKPVDNRMMAILRYPIYAEVAK